MTVDRHRLIAAARDGLAVPDGVDTGATIIDLAARAAAWLDALGADGPGPGVEDLDALCRQIDVRHRLSARYGAGWKRTDPEIDAPDAVVAAVVTAVLAVAARGADPGRDLKLVNSALKALELRAHPPSGPALRGWAVEILDRATVDAS